MKKISYISYQEAKKLDDKLIRDFNISMETLIRQAGQGISQWVHENIHSSPIIGIIGKGNNGRDVLSAFMQLKEYYTLYAYLEHKSIKTDKYFIDLMHQKNIKIIHKLTNLPINATLVDGLFGTGLNRPLDQRTQRIIQQINQCGMPIVSIDIPSGLSERKQPSMSVIATTTLTMMLPKKVFQIKEKKARCGSIHLINFDLPKNDLQPLIFPNTIKKHIKLS